MEADLEKPELEDYDTDAISVTSTVPEEEDGAVSAASDQHFQVDEILAEVDFLAIHESEDIATEWRDLPDENGELKRIEVVTKYLVQWSGYPFSQCTWEPKENFDGPLHLEKWDKKKASLINENVDVSEYSEKISDEFEDALRIVEQNRDSRKEKRAKKRQKLREQLKRTLFPDMDPEPTTDAEHGAQNGAATGTQSTQGSALFTSGPPPPLVTKRRRPILHSSASSSSSSGEDEPLFKRRASTNPQNGAPTPRPALSLKTNVSSKQVSATANAVSITDAASKEASRASKKAPPARQGSLPASKGASSASSNKAALNRSAQTITNASATSESSEGPVKAGAGPAKPLPSNGKSTGGTAKRSSQGGIRGITKAPGRIRIINEPPKRRQRADTGKPFKNISHQYAVLKKGRQERVDDFSKLIAVYPDKDVEGSATTPETTKVPTSTEGASAEENVGAEGDASGGHGDANPEARPAVTERAVADQSSTKDDPYGRREPGRRRVPVEDVAPSAARPDRDNRLPDLRDIPRGPAAERQPQVGSPHDRDVLPKYRTPPIGCYRWMYLHESCYISADDCPYAHGNTGWVQQLDGEPKRIDPAQPPIFSLEPRNRRMTCWFWWTHPIGCSNRDCDFAHHNTGLLKVVNAARRSRPGPSVIEIDYLEQPVSKKRKKDRTETSDISGPSPRPPPNLLTCAFWANDPRGCRNTAEECKFQHYETGHVAPLPEGYRIKGASGLNNGFGPPHVDDYSPGPARTPDAPRGRALAQDYADQIMENSSRSRAPQDRDLPPHDQGRPPAEHRSRSRGPPQNGGVPPDDLLLSEPRRVRWEEDKYTQPSYSSLRQTVKDPAQPRDAQTRSKLLSADTRDKGRSPEPHPEGTAPREASFIPAPGTTTTPSAITLRGAPGQLVMAPNATTPRPGLDDPQRELIREIGAAFKLDFDQLFPKGLDKKAFMIFHPAEHLKELDMITRWLLAHSVEVYPLGKAGAWEAFSRHILAGGTGTILAHPAWKEYECIPRFGEILRTSTRIWSVGFQRHNFMTMANLKTDSFPPQYDCVPLFIAGAIICITTDVFERTPEEALKILHLFDHKLHTNPHYSIVNPNIRWRLAVQPCLEDNMYRWMEANEDAINEGDPDAGLFAKITLRLVNLHNKYDNASKHPISMQPDDYYSILEMEGQKEYLKILKGDGPLAANTMQVKYWIDKFMKWRREYRHCFVVHTEPEETDWQSQWPIIDEVITPAKCVEYLEQTGPAARIPFLEWVEDPELTAEEENIVEIVKKMRFEIKAKQGAGDRVRFEGHSRPEQRHVSNELAGHRSTSAATGGPANREDRSISMDLSSDT
ncbi:hypothetical protein M011DRAFT_472483 [Sporormia fimetaria CBS 119925]|uniref:Chromo domain-containing protein n=1 Tax=Sporormia fimetaria CBS 119925 TaxID=1340428 RepID=A0A6A6UV81_9PLEO|nr:hypothetical protein M011DRAFT_472483 [Sporormia fimetaria CBS 119925]